MAIRVARCVHFFLKFLFFFSVKAASLSSRPDYSCNKRARREKKTEVGRTPAENLSRREHPCTGKTFWIALGAFLMPSNSYFVGVTRIFPLHPNAGGR